MAKNKVRMKGTLKINKNLVKAISKIRGNTREGIKAASKLIRDKAKPLISIDTGLLESTAKFRTGFIGPGKGKPAGVVFVDTDYAPFVHEMPDTTNWQRPGAENKFLEKAVSRNIPAILNILRRFTGKTPK